MASCTEVADEPNLHAELHFCIENIESRKGNSVRSGVSERISKLWSAVFVSNNMRKDLVHAKQFGHVFHIDRVVRAQALHELGNLRIGIADSKHHVL